MEGITPLPYRVHNGFTHRNPMIDNKTVIQTNTTPILFVNFSDSPYEIKWDGQVQRTLNPKESQWFPFWLAEHAAKHLVDREMNLLKLATDHHSRETFMAKCIGNKPPEKGAKTSDPLGLEALNRNMAEKESKPDEILPKKSGRPKKIKEVSTDEDSFEGK